MNTDPKNGPHVLKGWIHHIDLSDSAGLLLYVKRSYVRVHEHPFEARAI